MRIIVAIVVALASRSVYADPDPAAPRLAQLAKAANCEDNSSPFRPWCTATKWATGTPAALPAGKVLLGITVEIEDGKATADALRDRVSLSAWSVGADGTVKLTTVKPTDQKETEAVATAVFDLAAQMKRKTQAARVPKALGDYLATLKGKYKPTKTATEWTWDGESAGRARKVGDYWVVIEAPKQGKTGIWVTIATDAWVAMD